MEKSGGSACERNVRRLELSGGEYCAKRPLDVCQIRERGVQLGVTLGGLERCDGDPGAVAQADECDEVRRMYGGEFIFVDGHGG